MPYWALCLFWASLVLTGQYWVIQGLTWPYLALLGKALLGLTGPYWALLALLGLTGPYWALLGKAKALLGLTWPYWALLGLTGPHWALQRVILHLMTD